MRIALDAHGGDFGLRPNLEGALLAAKKLPHEIILVGRDPEIREELRRMGAENPERIRIVHAPQLIDMAAPRELPTPLAGGVTDVLSELRATSGWAVRPETVTIISAAP